MLCSPWVSASAVKGWPTDICGEDEKELLVLAASELVYARSGQQWPGVCEAMVRPCGISTIEFPSGVWASAGLDRWAGLGWPWAWSGCCGEGRGCLCSRFRRLDLPGGRVLSIDEITIDGMPLDPADYRVDPPRTLVRLDGHAWPCSQNLNADPGDPHTFTVAYTYGAEPPKAGELAVIALALELAKAHVGDPTCQLPARVTEVSRQSTTVAIESITSLLSEGLTGVPAVDLFVASVNPSRAIRSGRVRNPDRPTRVTVNDLGGS